MAIRGRQWPGYVIHFVNEGKRTEVRPGLDFTPVDSRYNCFISHNQSETEGFVRDFTKSEYGSEVEYNTRFVDLTQDDDGVTATVIHSDKVYEDRVVRREDPWGRPYYWQGGIVVMKPDQPGTDVQAVSEGFVAITPLSVDWTDRALLSELQART